MFETDNLPNGWVKKCNAMNEVWVPCTHNVESFVRAGVRREKLFVLPEAVDSAFFNPEIVRKEDCPAGAGFRFVSVFEWNKRKGWDILIRAYFSLYTVDDDVELVIKTRNSNGAHEQVRSVIMFDLKQEDPSKWAKYRIIDEDIPPTKLRELYRSADVFVLPTRGEGWARPVTEAMSMALPVIVTNWSGPADFLTSENSIPLSFRMQEISSNDGMNGYYVGHGWAEPDLEHLKRSMSGLRNSPDTRKRLGDQARKDMVERFTPEKVNDIFVGRLGQIQSKLAK
jgi:glycosyltransferase involved in cell wall biosynthesis